MYGIKSILLEDVHGRRLNTTANTSFEIADRTLDVDWSQAGIEQTQKIICCLEIESVKGNSYYECKSLHCKRKINPDEGDKNHEYQMRRGHKHIKDGS